MLTGVGTARVWLRNGRRLQLLWRYCSAFICYFEFGSIPYTKHSLQFSDKHLS